MINQTVLKKLIPIPFILGIMTALVTNFRIEEGQSFFQKWGSFYCVALFVVAPIGILVFISINFLIDKYLANQNNHLKGLVFGVLMASIIGSLMTVTSIYVIKSFSTIQDFLGLAKEAVRSALPFIMLIGAFVGGVVKPLVSKSENKID
jgi:hypothetical protein